MMKCAVTQNTLLPMTIHTHTCILCTGSAKAMPLLLVKNKGNNILNEETLAEVCYFCSPIPEKRSPF
jgi:hypothetical protein